MEECGRNMDSTSKVILQPEFFKPVFG